MRKQQQANELLKLLRINAAGKNFTAASAVAESAAAGIDDAGATENPVFSGFPPLLGEDDAAPLLPPQPVTLTSNDCRDRLVLVLQLLFLESTHDDKIQPVITQVQDAQTIDQMTESLSRYLNEGTDVDKAAITSSCLMKHCVFGSYNTGLAAKVLLELELAVQVLVNAVEGDKQLDSGAVLAVGSIEDADAADGGGASRAIDKSKMQEEIGAFCLDFNFDLFPQAFRSESFIPSCGGGF